MRTYKITKKKQKFKSVNYEHNSKVDPLTNNHLSLYVYIFQQHKSARKAQTSEKANLEKANVVQIRSPDPYS